MKENKGRILRIEKSSIHDGEGLRTVVFFKGCPLRCQWCSTPESQRMEQEYGYGADMTVNEIMKEICKDEIFFFHSGGGVTLSGGEVLLQPDFAADLLKNCAEQGIETAIETSLYADYSSIEKLLPYLDAMYIDFKLFDNTAHEIYTGESNKRIKENLKRVEMSFPGDIHIRIPIIPGINMTRENIEATARFFLDFRHITDLELLPYHRLGLDTYRKLNRHYLLPDIMPPSAEELKKYAEIFRLVNPDITIKSEP